MLRRALPIVLAVLFIGPALAQTYQPSAKSPQAGTAQELPLVWVLATGGTIAGQASSSTNLSDYKSGSLRGEDLVDRVPEIRQIARVKVEQIANLSSSDLAIEHWLTLANRINAIFDADPKAAGIVVTHGTDTLEETAYFLNLTVRHDRPVVVVGSMRPASAISADGPLNLLNAVRTASAPNARGRGVLVVLNDQINAAREVTKTNTYRVETFKAPDLGLLGYVDADKVSFYRATTRRHTVNSEFDVTGLKQLPRTDIVYTYVETNPAVLRALVSDGVRGIVFAGSGAGSVPRTEQDALAALTQSLPPARRPVIVRASRTGSGRVIGVAEYDALGMIPADTLNPQKARVLLMLGLLKTSDLGEIRRMFAEY